MKKKRKILYFAAVFILTAVLGSFPAKAETIADRVEAGLEINKFAGFEKTYYEKMYYDIKLSKSGILNFDFNYGAEKDALTSGLDLKVFDEKGNEIDDSSVSPTGNVFFKLDAGRYIIEISQNMYAAGKYKGYFYLTFEEELKDTIQMTLTLKKGNSIQLGAVVKPTAKSTYTWTSSNKKAATVTKKGLVKAKKKGKTTIKVTANADYSKDLVATIVIYVVDK